jgi:phosphohistidine phosphatase
VQVFLIRHASAVDETLTVRDPHRPLAAEGRAQATGLGDRMRWHDCMPTHVWTSPLVRAVQTTELVCAGLHAKITVEVVPALAPDGAVRDVAAAIRALPQAAAVMVVGHEPGLSALGALLVGDPQFEALAKCQCARIVDGVVRWRFAGDGEAPIPPADRSG